MSWSELTFGTGYRFPYSVPKIPGALRGMVRHWWQRRTRGFDSSEVWALHYSLADWLAKRLEALADMSNGAPMGYPSGGFDPEGTNTDHDAWVRDIRKAAAAFREHVECEDMTGPWWESSTTAEHVERERAADRACDEAMLWIARWWRALWD